MSDTYKSEPVILKILHRQTVDEFVTLLRKRSILYCLGAGRKLQEQAEKELETALCRMLGILYSSVEKQEEKTVRQKFMRCIPELLQMIQTDVEAAFEGDPAAENYEEILLTYPGVFAVLVYRAAHILHSQKVPILPRVLTEYAHSGTGIDIHPGASIGGYFFIDHGTGVVIGETTVIGERVKLYQGVTLGAVSTRDGRALHHVKRHPTIEDDVTIYAGASILGGNTVIGSGTVIGANAFVTISIPAKSKVNAGILQNSCLK